MLVTQARQAQRAFQGKVACLGSACLAPKDIVALQVTSGPLEILASKAVQALQGVLLK